MRPSTSVTLETNSHPLLCVLSVCWLSGCSDGWVMRWLVAWLVGWLADWMDGWLVCSRSLVRWAPRTGAGKDSQNPGRERSSARKEVGRSWFFLNEERIAEQIVGVFGPQADQTVDLDMLRFLRRNVRKVFLTATSLGYSIRFPAAPMDWAKLPCHEGRKERQGQGQQRRPQEW